MTEVKICGIKRIEDVEFLNELKPEYAGFVFAESKRKVTFEKAGYLMEKLDTSIKRVGVFVNQAGDGSQLFNEIKQARNGSQVFRLDVLQFHGNVTEEYLSKFKNYEVWKCIKVDLETIVTDCEYVDGILLDGDKSGSGKTFDWKLAENIRTRKKLILAGGLNSYNVQEAISRLQPDVVDVSSSVEVDGFKDFKKIKEFIEKVRSCV